MVFKHFCITKNLSFNSISMNFLMHSHEQKDHVQVGVSWMNEQGHQGLCLSDLQMGGGQEAHKWQVLFFPSWPVSSGGSSLPTGWNMGFREGMWKQTRETARERRWWVLERPSFTAKQIYPESKIHLLCLCHFGQVTQPSWTTSLLWKIRV